MLRTENEEKKALKKNKAKNLHANIKITATKKNMIYLVDVMLNVVMYIRNNWHLPFEHMPDCFCLNIKYKWHHTFFFHHHRRHHQATINVVIIFASSMNIYKYRKQIFFEFFFTSFWQLKKYKDTTTTIFDNSYQNKSLFSIHTLILFFRLMIVTVVLVCHILSLIALYIIMCIYCVGCNIKKSVPDFRQIVYHFA